MRSTEACRITSYNVCYTKLLRSEYHDGGATDWVFAEAGEPAQRAAAQLVLDSPGFRFEPFRAGDREAGSEARVRFADLRLLGQLLSTYLVLETKDLV